MAAYIPVIGMEVHVELNTKSKMFCRCKNDPDLKEPNTTICEICMGHPGTLPLPNREAIISTVLIGKALGCSIRELSKFDRKHYFYPDLPKAYQISQYDEPIAEHGKIELHFFLEDNIREAAIIGITRAHLEEDTAKLFHDKDGNTLVDFNRSGVPLVEIVTDPDFKTALEAKMYCQELRTLFRYLGVSSADMEKGHMRCEANISLQEAGRFEIVNGVVRPLGDYVLHNKVELKNLNSFKAVEKAIEFEIQRQEHMLEQGETWLQQTRGWDENKQETVLQRTKENAADYRYFPEPDIPPFHPLTVAGDVSLPELPQARRIRFHEEYGFSYADAKILTDDKSWSEFAEAVMSEAIEWLHDSPEVGEKTEAEKNQVARLVGGWLTSKLMGLLNEKNKDISEFRVSAENFAELITLIFTNKINSTNAQKILLLMVEADTDIDPTHVMEEKGYGQVRDEGKIREVVDQVIVNYPTQVEQFKQGKEALMKFLVGMCMKATEGTADPQLVEKMLREKLI